MICPRCSSSLSMSNTHGVEIDYCPNCRGVWLDKGELEKIIERSNSDGPRYMDDDEHHHYQERHHDRHSDDHYDKHDDYRNRPRHRKSFFSELFDF